MPGGTTFGDIVKAAVVLAAVSFAQSALSRGKGKTAGVPTPVKQPIPAKWSGYGESRRMNPAYALYEIAPATGRSVDVMLMHQGKIEGFTEFWLHDDKGTAIYNTAPTTTAFGLDTNGWVRHRTGSDQRYGANPERVRLLKTDGSVPGTHMSAIGSQFSGTTWDSTHRGDGIALVGKIALHGDASTFARTYPNGDPLVTAAGKWQKCCDPRETDQVLGTPATHVWTRNPVLHLLHFLTIGEGGLGLDYDTWIDPHIDTWMTAANVCDEAVTLDAGGTEPRYTAGGGYYHNDPPAEIIADMLMAFDGKLLPASDGAYCCYAGKFQVPTVTLTDRDIMRSGTSLRRFQPDDQRVNELLLQYTDRTRQWQIVDAPAWRDEDNITDTGVVRSDTLTVEWCQSAATIQRLGKRRFMRLNATWMGTITTNLYGFKAMGQPTVRLQCPVLAAELGIPALEDMMFEIEDATPDFENLTVTFQVISAPDLVAGASPLDAWDAAAEEATATDPRDRPATLELDAPTITAAIASPVGGGVRARVTVDPPTDFDDLDALNWFLRWRVGSDPWSASMAFDDVSTSDPIYLETGPINAEALQFSAQYMLGDHRRSDWSDPFDADFVADDPFAELVVAVAQAQADATAAAAAAAASDARAADAEAAAAAAAATAGTALALVGGFVVGAPYVGTWTCLVTGNYLFEAFASSGDGGAPFIDDPSPGKPGDETTIDGGGGGAGATASKTYAVTAGDEVDYDLDGANCIVNSTDLGFSIVLGYGTTGAADGDGPIQGVGGAVITNDDGWADDDGRDGGLTNAWDGGGAGAVPDNTDFGASATVPGQAGAGSSGAGFNHYLRITPA